MGNRGRSPGGLGKDEKVQLGGVQPRLCRGGHTDGVAKNKQTRGTWVAHSVKHLTLDLSSGLDLRVVRSSPVLDSSMEPP